MNTNSMTNNQEGCRKAFGTTDSEVTKGINRREMYQTSLCAINDKSNLTFCQSCDKTSVFSSPTSL